MSIEGDVSANPGPVDNSPLFKNDPEEPNELREHMIDELDFVLVPDEAWQLLVDEFNITPGQEPIARKVKIIIMLCNLIVNFKCLCQSHILCISTMRMSGMYLISLFVKIGQRIKRQITETKFFLYCRVL